MAVQTVLNIMYACLQLPTQLYTAVLYTLITVVLLAQYVWYNQVKPRRKEAEVSSAASWSPDAPGSAC
jgi:hypothetical protein